MVVEVFTHIGAGELLVLHTWTVQNGQALCSNVAGLTYMEKMGVLGPDGTQLFPKDGEVFVEALSLTLRGPNLHARLAV